VSSDPTLGSAKPRSIESGNADLVRLAPAFRTAVGSGTQIVPADAASADPEPYPPAAPDEPQRQRGYDDRHPTGNPNKSGDHVRRYRDAVHRSFGTRIRRKRGAQIGTDIPGRHIWRKAVQMETVPILWHRVSRYWRLAADIVKTKNSRAGHKTCASPYPSARSRGAPSVINFECHEKAYRP